jgi:hypothetical protein
VGPFELCHCSRCRKTSGSAFIAGLGVRAADLRWLTPTERIRVYEAPLLERPPAYTSSFCSVCGSPVPHPDPRSEWFEIPAGCLDDDPGLRPDRHIFVEHKAPWFEISDGRPELTKTALVELRKRGGQGES